MRNTSLVWRRVHSLCNACTIKGLRINLKIRNSICCSRDKSFPIDKMFTCLFSVGPLDNFDFLMTSWLFHSIFSKRVLCFAVKCTKNSVCKLQHLDLIFHWKQQRRAHPSLYFPLSSMRGGGRRTDPNQLQNLYSL